MENATNSIENTVVPEMHKIFKKYAYISFAVSLALTLLAMIVGEEYPKWLFMLSVLTGTFLPAISAFTGHLAALLVKSDERYGGLPGAAAFRIRFLPEIVGWFIGLLASFAVEGLFFL